ncbi:MAG: hypothetical protein JSU86_15490 [Phycisphaerales bacterium]|nr:MAG: hypothetical protein JSU86_15490 [Phycisphaerales bacterium]
MSSVTAAEEPKVTIVGGADASGHNYSWTVTNEYTSPIVYLEFPHYHADLFFAPESWSTETTALVNVGSKDKPGVCIARAESPAVGILPGRALNFGMRVAPLPTRRGQGTVLVRFADGTESGIAGVGLPQPGSAWDEYASLIGLGTIFLLWIIFRARRWAKTRRIA